MKTGRNESAEQGFRRRYNRTVMVEQGREMNPDGTTKQTQTDITSKLGNKFIINEYLKNNLTDYATVTNNGKTHNFTSYLLAEIYIADEIGKEN